MKRLTKKSVFWSVVVTLIVVSILFSPIVWFYYVSIWSESASYEEYAKDFNVVKNYIAAEFPNETDKYLAVSVASGQGIRLFDPDVGKYLQVPEDVLLSLEIIDKEAFPSKDANFDIIRIYKGRISFGIENGSYELVYSPEEKPSWLNSPKDTKVFVKKIGNGWYHVARNPG